LNLGEEVSAAIAAFREALEAFMARFAQAQVQVIDRLWRKKSAMLDLIEKRIAWIEINRHEGMAMDFSNADAVLDGALKKRTPSGEEAQAV
jgi:hypothetical protein